MGSKARRLAAIGCALSLVPLSIARPTRAQEDATSPPTAANPEPPAPTATNPEPPALPSAPAAAPASSEAPTTGANPMRSAAEPTLIWNDAWPRFRPIGYGITALSVAGALAATFLVPYPERPRWTGGILFDDAFRDAFRARSPAVRDAIRLASDVTLVTSIVHVALVDSLIIPLSDASPDVAWQLTLMNAQAFSLNILISTMLYKIAARARPSYQTCQSNPNFDPLCKSGSLASFPSSHASTAFTAAGLTCVHHAYLPIYGGGVWDTTACVSSLVVASATAAFRVIGDRHYASDVIIGAGLGFALGYVYPWLFHYRYGTDSSSNTGSARAEPVHWGLIPGAGDGPYGVSMAGMF